MAAGWARVVKPEKPPGRGGRGRYAALVEDEAVVEAARAEGRLIRLAWSTPTKRVLVLTAFLAVAAGIAWLGGAGDGRFRQRFLRSRFAGPGGSSGGLSAGPLVLAETGEDGEELDPDEPFCGSMERGFNFVGISEIRAVQGVPSPGICCSVCQAEPACRAWVWGPPTASQEFGPANVCRLKALDPIQGITRVADGNYFSGQPFRKPAEDSLFCFSLTQSDGYELGLLALQHRTRSGIFACDEYAIYSNKVIEVAAGVNSSVVDSTLKCESGGEFGTALNTDIFMAVWTKVVSDGRYRYNDWTAKVDPDSVFFPERLRISVHFHKEHSLEPGGVYLNNCKFGLHGPIEVFSRLAVLAWASGSAQCVQHFDELCSGPCLWGEDMFIDQCLSKVLNVKRIDDWNLLSEAHCDSKDWQLCSNGAIAFHPFKGLDEYRECMSNARYGALPQA